MSLKFFHVFFICTAFLLAVFCTAWAFMTNAVPAFGYSCGAFAVGLAVYAVWYIGKTRNIIV